MSKEEVDHARSVRTLTCHRDSDYILTPEDGFTLGDLRALLDALDEAEKKLAGMQRTLSEAFNSGDGSYKP
jgi:hypothetical protein